MSLHFELSDRELKRLGLNKKIPVEWWGPDCVKHNGRNAFYYEHGVGEGKGISNPLELEQAYPSCLIIRDKVKTPSSIISNVVRLERIPNNSLKLVKFSHYCIIEPYIYSLRYEVPFGRFSCDRTREVTIAAFNFLRLKRR